jgi:PTS system nitrogen regulatory IIA component
VHHDVGGADREGVLRALIEVMNLPEGVDRELVFEFYLAREALGSTGVGDGIAIPHVRNPMVLHVERPFITLCFLAKAVDFGAIDGRPVTTLFSVVAPTTRAHLQLLSRLSLALHDPGFRSAITRRASEAEVLGEARRVEEGFRKPEPARKD